MPEPGKGEVEKDKGQQLLDEMHGINVGLDRLAPAVEELTDVVAAAADIELVDEDGEPAEPDEAYRGSPAGTAFGTFGKVLSDFMKNMSRGTKADGE